MDELQPDWLANGVTGEGMKLEGYNFPNFNKSSLNRYYTHARREF
jgi:hypothetical protein